MARTREGPNERRDAVPGGFVSHGHSLLYLMVIEFLRRLGFRPIYAENDAVAGRPVRIVVREMIGGAGFGVIVATGEDVTVDGRQHPRLNVVHELGLCQALLGDERTIILKQAGTTLPSNISDILYIEFEGDRIDHTFHELERALLSWGLLTSAPVEQTTGV